MRSAPVIALCVGLAACEPEPPGCRAGDDCSAPVVRITQPAPGERVEGWVAVEGTVSDLAGATMQVELLLDGALVGASDSAERFSFRLDAEACPVGGHVLRVRATDAAGNEGFDEVNVESRLLDLPGCPVNAWQRQHWRNHEGLGRPEVRCEPGPIDYDWGYGSPDGEQPTELFMLRWSGTWEFEAGPYDFVARADDGLRLWVDGEPIIDAWRQQPPTDFTARRVMTAGRHAVRLDYYEATSIAVIRLAWAPAQ